MVVNSQRIPRCGKYMLAGLTLPLPATISELVIVLGALIILWIIVSIPVYFAGKLVTDGKVELRRGNGSNPRRRSGLFHNILWRRFLTWTVPRSGCLSIGLCPCTCSPGWPYIELPSRQTGSGLWR